MNPFSELGIRHDIVNAITELGFENPTPIQEQSIPVLLSGSNDFVGLAQTGTGKTAAFGLPLLELLDFSKNHPQALILCPTRELCLQITNDLKNYSKNVSNVNVVAVYGGASISDRLGTQQAQQRRSAKEDRRGHRRGAEKRTWEGRQARALAAAQALERIG